MTTPGSIKAGSKINKQWYSLRNSSHVLHLRTNQLRKWKPCIVSSPKLVPESNLTECLIIYGRLFVQWHLTVTCCDVASTPMRYCDWFAADPFGQCKQLLLYTSHGERWTCSIISKLNFRHCYRQCWHHTQQRFRWYYGSTWRLCTYVSVTFHVIKFQSVDCRVYFADGSLSVLLVWRQDTIWSTATQSQFML